MVVECECRQETGERVIRCDSCDSWLHYSCAKLSNQQVRRIKEYYCDKCVTRAEQKKRILRNVWKVKQLDDEEKLMKQAEFYDVKEIIGHHDLEDGSREFLVRWLGYAARDATWEPEENLIGCVDILQHYCHHP